MSRASRRKATQAWLERSQRIGQLRATATSQQRVLAATMDGERRGLSRFDAAVEAIARETKQPIEDVRRWLGRQVEKRRAQLPAIPSREPERAPTWLERMWLMLLSTLGLAEKAS